MIAVTAEAELIAIATATGMASAASMMECEKAISFASDMMLRIAVATTAATGRLAVVLVAVKGDSSSVVEP